MVARIVNGEDDKKGMEGIDYNEINPDHQVLARTRTDKKIIEINESNQYVL